MPLFELLPCARTLNPAVSTILDYPFCLLGSAATATEWHHEQKKKTYELHDPTTIKRAKDLLSW